ncbi:hypothetical protein [Paenibacillus sp. AGC30]
MELNETPNLNEPDEPTGSDERVILTNEYQKGCNQSVISGAPFLCCTFFEFERDLI